MIGLAIGVGGGFAVVKHGLPLLLENSKIVTPSPSPINVHTDFHQHVDLRVVIEGQQLDLAKDEYQSSTYVYKDEHIHLHDNNGGVVHLHEPGVTLGDFLQTLDMELTDECFTMYEAAAENESKTGEQERQVIEAHCKQAGDGKSLVVMVNGDQQLDGAGYKLQDLDKILVYFGVSDQKMIADQMGLVSDDACMYSETCPERGKPPAENCTASADTPCVVAE